MLHERMKGLLINGVFIVSWRAYIWAGNDLRDEGYDKPADVLIWIL